MNRVDYLLKHPFNTLSDMEQLFVTNLGPDQPDIALTQTHKTQTRHFNARWYKRKPWLTASERKKSLFCFNCLLFGGDMAWTLNGVRDLKHLSERVKHHEHTSRHIENTLKLDSLSKQKGTISVQLRNRRSSSLSGTAENFGKPSKPVTADIFSVKYATLEDPLMIPSTEFGNITPTTLQNASAAFGSVNASASVQSEKTRSTASQTISLVFNPVALNSEETGVTIECFGDELSAGERPAAETQEKQQNKDSVKEVLFHLRAEKLLLELDKLRLERQKMVAERQNIQLRADILSLRKQLIAESVQTEVSTSTTAPLAAKEIDMMAASSHHTPGLYSQHVSHSQCLISKENSVLLKHLVTFPETDVPPSDQTILCQQSINVDTLPVTSNSSKHHGGKLFNETTQQSMITENLVSYSRDNIGPRNGNVTELHEFVEILPGDVNSESTHNVKLKSNQNVEKSPSSSVAEQMKNDTDVPIMCRSCALNSLHKCTKSSNDEGDGATDESGNSDTHANASKDTPHVQNVCSSLLRQTDEMDASFGSSYKHTDMDGSLHKLKNSVILILGKNDTSHKHVESSQCRREQLWDLEHYSQRCQEETCRDQHSSSVSRKKYSDSQKSEFDARCGNTVQTGGKGSCRGSQEMVWKSFHASKHGKTEVSDTNDKDDSATLCKRMKTDIQR